MFIYYLTSAYYYSERSKIILFNYPYCDNKALWLMNIDFKAL